MRLARRGAWVSCGMLLDTSLRTRERASESSIRLVESAPYISFLSLSLFLSLSRLALAVHSRRVYLISHYRGASADIVQSIFVVFVVVAAAALLVSSAATSTTLLPAEYPHSFPPTVLLDN